VVTVIPTSEVSEDSFKTTCCYCGVGCGVDVSVKNGELHAVKGDENHPANYGRLCVKGSSLHETHQSPDRLLKPVLHGKEVEWDEAIGYSAKKFKQIAEEHGPDSVALYLSGQLLTEDYYVANKFIKGFVGTANVDTNSRLCMASAVVAHKRAFGGDLVPGCYEDLESTDLLILVGSNMAYAHPVIYQRIVKAKAERPNMQVVVIDPRKTATSDVADIHLRIRPGADAYFFNGLLSYLADNKGLDAEYIEKYCDNFDEALSAAKSQVPNITKAAQLCDLSEDVIKEVYDLFRTRDKAVTVFSMGINQSSSGVDKGNAIINCHLASGKIGRPGACPFSITGQPNAMGGREVGGLANQLAAHMGYASESDIDLVGNFWNAPNMSRKEGLKAVDMFKAVYEGKIKAIWIMATNPVVSMPDADFVKEALEKCELVIVSECIANTDTAKTADVLFPATTWSEKYGTVTNSERCISLQKNILPPPGESRHDWQIICDFAKAMGYSEGFNFSHPVEVFREHAALSGEQNNDTRGFNISYLQNISQDDYENFKPICWPVTAEAPEGTPRLFTEGKYFTPNKKAKFIPIEARLPKLTPLDGEVNMNTGRIRDQWHTMSRTGNASKLLAHIDEPFIDMNPKDAEDMGMAEGSLVELSNLSSRYIGRLKFNLNQRLGEVFVPMHWNGRFAAKGRADALVNPFTDPMSGQPEFKQVPVRVQAYQPAWQAIVYSVEEYQSVSDFWVKIPLNTGYKYRLGGPDIPDSWMEWAKDQFAHIDDWVELHDSQSQNYRAAGFVDDRLSVLFIMQTQGEPPEANWVEQQLDQVCDAKARLSILAGSAGSGEPDVGATICSCFQVGENTIINAIEGGCQSAAALGQKLNCGTNCGSCIPELNGLIAKHGVMEETA